MPDPLDPGASFDPGNLDPQKVNDVLSQLQQLPALLNAAAGNAETLNAAFNRLNDLLETRIKPAIAGLGKLPGSVSKQFKIYEDDLKNITNVHKKYYDLVATEEQRRLSRIRDNLQQELILIKLHYQEVIKVAQTTEEKRRLGLEYKAATQKRRDVAYEEEVRGAPRGTISSLLKIPEAMQSMTSALSGLFAVSELLNLAIGAYQAQYRAGGALSRATGQDITLGGGQGAMVNMLGQTATSLIGVDSAASLLNETLSKAPQLAQQNLEPAIGAMAHFGITVHEAVKMITEASARAGTTAKQFNENWGVAVGLVDKFKKSGIDMVWATNRMTDFAAALVQTGVNSDTANQQAQVFVNALATMQSHLKLTTAQMEPFVQSLTGVVSGMSPEKAIGLLSLPGMGGIPNLNNPNLMDELSKRTGSTSFFTNMRGSFGQMGIPAGLQNMEMMRMLGMQGSILQTKEFGEFMKDLRPGMDITKEMQRRGLGSEADNIASIAKTTLANQDIMTVLKNFLQRWLGTTGPMLEGALTAHQTTAGEAVGAGIWAGASMVGATTEQRQRRTRAGGGVTYGPEHQPARVRMDNK